MSATSAEFLEMMIVNHEGSNKFLLSPDTGRNCLTHIDDLLSLSPCSGTGSFVSMEMSFPSEEKEPLKYQTRRLSQDLPSVMPTKQEAHLLENVENIIDEIMIDFEEVWNDVSLVDNPSNARSIPPSDLPSPSPSDHPRVRVRPSLLTVPSSSLAPSMEPSDSPTLSPYPLISMNLNFTLILDLCAYITFGLEQSLTEYLRRDPDPLNGLEVFWVESVTVLNNCTEAEKASPYIPQNIIYTIVTARVSPGFPSTTPTLKRSTAPSLFMLPSANPISAPSGLRTIFPTKIPTSISSEIPTSTPSISSSRPTISLKPSLASTNCTDWYGFEDAYGDDCKWYEEQIFNVHQCPFYAQYWANADGVSADIACCYW